MSNAVGQFNSELERASGPRTRYGRPDWWWWSCTHPRAANRTPRGFGTPGLRSVELAEPLTNWRFSGGNAEKRASEKSMGRRIGA